MNKYLGRFTVGNSVLVVKIYIKLNVVPERITKKAFVGHDSFCNK